MKVRNKLTKETLNISCAKFKIMFAKEIRVAIESYQQTELNKYFSKIQTNNSIEQDFYFNLQWNFNHFGMSNWYIERLD